MGESFKLTVNVKKYTFTWKIENYSFLEHCGEKEVESNDFFPAPSRECKLKLTTHMANQSYECQDIELIVCSPSDSKFVYKFLVKVLDWKNQLLGENRSDLLVNSTKEVLLHVNRRTLLNNIGHEDMLVIELELTYISPESNDPGFTHSSEGAKDDSPDLQDNLITNLYAMLDEKKFCDVAIKVTKYPYGKIKAHKFILAARSEVFAAMFNHDMVEQQTCKITIEDFDRNTIQKFLNFLYTADVPEFSQSLKDTLSLLKIGNKYLVKDLEYLCVDHLISTRKAKNATKVLEVADLIGNEKLQNAYKNCLN